MLVNFLLDIVIFLIKIVVGFFPDSDFWPLPAGFYSAVSWTTEQINTARMFMPDNFVPNVAAAVTFVFAVNVWVLPWLWARGAKLPFASLIKRS